MSRWERGEFRRSLAVNPDRPESFAKGYVKGCFGITNIGREWYVIHTPTGFGFLYSSWDRLRDAQAFCEGMLAKGSWDFNQHAVYATEITDRFNRTCHHAAKQLGFRRRELKRISL